MSFLAFLQSFVVPTIIIKTWALIWSPWRPSVCRFCYYMFTITWSFPVDLEFQTTPKSSCSQEGNNTKGHNSNQLILGHLCHLWSVPRTPPPQLSLNSSCFESMTATDIITAYTLNERSSNGSPVHRTYNNNNTRGASHTHRSCSHGLLVVVLFSLVLVPDEDFHCSEIWN